MPDHTWIGWDIITRSADIASLFNTLVVVSAFFYWRIQLRRYSVLLTEEEWTVARLAWDALEGAAGNQMARPALRTAIEERNNALGLAVIDEALKKLESNRFLAARNGTLAATQDNVYQVAKLKRLVTRDKK